MGYFMRIIFLLALGLLVEQASATEISYSHEYQDVSKTHTDKIKLEHEFKNGLELGTEIKLQPVEQRNGDQGIAFHHDRLDSIKYEVKYSFKLPYHLSLKPGFSYTQARAREKQTYKPSLKLTWKAIKNLKFATRYRYETTHYKEGKPNKYTNRYDVYAEYKLYDIELEYRYSLLATLY